MYELTEKQFTVIENSIRTIESISIRDSALKELQSIKDRISKLEKVNKRLNNYINQYLKHEVE